MNAPAQTPVMTYRDFASGLAEDLIATAKELDVDHPRDLLDAYIEQFSETLSIELEARLSSTK